MDSEEKEKRREEKGKLTGGRRAARELRRVEVGVGEGKFARKAQSVGGDREEEEEERWGEARASCLLKQNRGRAGLNNRTRV